MAKCIQLPLIPPLNLPEGVSLAVPLPQLPQLPGICCLRLPKLPFKIPTQLGVAIPIPLVATLKAALAAIDEYLDSLTDFPCPRL